ncbi:MAG: hypothetical protein KDA44_22375, partial [Planctomycetales bacterium]|nr:hypothetical protein [Planctomycetales bacterium]
PVLADQWTVEATIDPANPSWWQNLPAWTHLPALAGISGPLVSNRQPQVRQTNAGEFIELPRADPDGETAWLAVPLPVRRPGLPYAVEFEFPADAAQDLAVSIREPDRLADGAAGQRDAGLCITPTTSADAAGAVTHRVEFWPRTGAPLLLVANRSPHDALLLGKIRVLRQTIVDPVAADSEPGRERLTLAYFSTPYFAGGLGTARSAQDDSASVDNWAANLQAAQRLAQTVRSAGYNGAIVCVAEANASLLSLSSRCPIGDGGEPLPQPARCDVLETLLRIFDREGLTLAPAIELNGPLAAIEKLSGQQDPLATGWECVDHLGRTWRGAQSEGSVGDLGELTPRYNLLNPDVQHAVRESLIELAAQCQGHRCYGGLALQLDGEGYGVLPGLAWCLDDATTERFAEEAGIALPQTGTDRFTERATQLLGTQRAAWTNWRQQKLTAFYRELTGALPDGSQGTKLVFCIERAYETAAAQHRLRQALAGKCSVLLATDELGLDLRGLAEIDGAVLLRPQWLASGSALNESAIDGLVSSAVEIEDALSGARVGEMLYYPANETRLSGLLARLRDDADDPGVRLSGPSIPVGGDAGEPAAIALARRECRMLAVGGPAWPSGGEAALRSALVTFRKLPPAGAETRLQRVQPMTMRVYRTAGATVACLVNPTPWPVHARLPLTADETASWSRLCGEVAGNGAAVAEPSGTLPQGESAWELTLPPFSVEARQWQTPRLRVGLLAVDAPASAADALRGQLSDVETRMSRLNERRAFAALANADFEGESQDGAVAGWQPRIGARGSVAVDPRIASSGQRSLHLVSADAMGVAAQSELFAGPTTGRMTITAQVRGLNFHPETRLYVGVEFDAAGQWQRRYRMVLSESTGAEWLSCEFDADDLPLDGAPTRVQFHLTGPGEAWIDGVELYDIRFTNAERIDLAKRFFAAKLALEEGKLGDCQQMLASYWPQYLLQHIPAEGSLDATREHELRIADAETKPEDASSTEEPTRRRLTDRVRELAPRLWR